MAASSLIEALLQQVSEKDEYFLRGDSRRIRRGGWWRPKLRALTSFPLLMLLFSLQFAVLATASLTLRVRLPSGVVQRLSIDDEQGAETIATLRDRIVGHYSLAPDGNSTISIKNVDYVWSDSSKNATRLSDLGMAAGEMIDVVAAAPAPGGTISAGDRLPKKPKSAAAEAGAATPKKVASLAELQRLRKEMIKVTRQRSTGKRAVAVSPSVAGILKRVSTGGVALLIGRSLVEPALKQGNAGGGKTRVMSGGDGKNEERRECIEVHAACELFHGKVFPEDLVVSDVLSGLVSTSTVANIAKKLGLSVVGCAIGYPCANEKEKAPLWSPQHVVTALQLRPVAAETGSNRFVVLSAAPDATVVKTPTGTKLGAKVRQDKKSKSKPGEAGGGGGTKRLQRKGGGTSAAVRSVTRGLTLEAFELSEQAAVLHDRQILPSRLLAGDGKGKSKSKSKGKGNAGKTKLKSPTKGGKTEADTDGECLVLNGNVLIANGVETKEIDPFLLAVPMPIVAIGTGSASPRKPKGIVTAKTASSPPWRPAPLGVSFEHSFPSAIELQNSDSPIAKKASRHVLQVLADAAQPKMVARLRDVQLLLHLSKMLDEDTMRALCTVLATPATALPQGVLTAMEMLKLSLAGSSEDEGEL